uniref:patatin-like phospholipase domain-containing protein 4 n=1 Tax=Myxine glutinosa TaxID=7769 RepID=UPI00358F5158
MAEIHLSFAGAGFMGIYHLGACAALLQNGRALLARVRGYAGASAGALVATVLLTSPENLSSANKFLMELSQNVRNQPIGAITPGFDFRARLREGIEQLLLSNAHETADGRLFVSITNAWSGRNELVSRFSSRDELITVLEASSFIPFYVGLEPVRYRDQLWLDGGLSNNLPLLPGGRTITISPFSGDHDVSPREADLRAIYARISRENFQVSVCNAIRAALAVLPPPQCVMEQIYERGEKDTVRFLRSNGFYQEE